MRTLDPAMSPMELLEEWLYTFARLDAYELTRPLAVELTPLEEQWNLVLQREIALLRQRTLARALVTAADGDLDQFLEAFNNALLTLVGNDRAAELYRRFFARRPSELKRPVLGEQLTTMAGWIGTLEKLESPELAAQGQKLQPLVQKGQAAETALQRAVQELDDFTTLKEHKAFVDRLNATRSRVHGSLNELRHARPELNLPADFAEQFFLRDERSRGPTLASQKKIVERLEKQLERQRETLSRLEGEAETDAQEAAARAALEQELAKLEEQRREVERREAELRNKLKR
jgi:hypothetical protein